MSLLGSENISGETKYKVIVAEIRHLGDQPTAIGEAGIFIGPYFHAKFNLPDNLDAEELAVFQCRTKDNQLNNKMFFLNHKPLPDILEPHPANKREWMMDIAIVPKGWLKVGENNIHVGYSDENYDDFVIDNLVLWYKTQKSTSESKAGTKEPEAQDTRKDIDSLEDLSSLETKVLRDDELEDQIPK
jgi:hypothetical protein